jgi:hypothetical protein
MNNTQQKTLAIFSNEAMRKCLAPLVFVLLMVGAASASAQEKSADQWQYDFEVYGWLPQIDITSVIGGDIKLTLKDLLQNLDMMAMFDFGARKNKWSMHADVIYLNLGAKEEISGEIIGHPVSLGVDVDLRGFISTVHGGYQVVVNDKNQMDVIAGIRYLYLRLPLEFNLGDRTRKVTLGGSDEDKWDGIVGLQGVRTINDKWYFDYYGDIGAGESDLTFQTKLGFGYHFNKFTGTFGFRYLRWNFDDKKGDLENMYVIGPYVGAKWAW